MLFLFNLGKSAIKAKKMIDETYRKDSVDTNMIREWFAKFKKRNFDLKEKPRSGIEEAKPKSVVHLMEYEERTLLRLAEA